MNLRATVGSPVHWGHDLRRGRRRVLGRGGGGVGAGDRCWARGCGERAGSGSGQGRGSRLTNLGTTRWISLPKNSATSGLFSSRALSAMTSPSMV